MRRYTLYIGALAVAVAVAGISAEARMHAPYRAHRILPANAALDTFATPAAAYSFRKLRTAYAGPAVKLRRVDTTTADIGFTVGGDFDTASATAFCTTACTVDTWYDQSGNARHLVQVTPASQPPYIQSCSHGRPCADFTGAVSVGLASQTPPSIITSIAVVANKVSGAGPHYLSRQNGSAGNRLIGSATANVWALQGGASGSINPAAADGAWHSGIGVINGNNPASSLTIDGVTTTGSVTGSVTAGTLGPAGQAAMTFYLSENVVWGNYALTAPETTALAANQQQYWMPAALDSFTQPSGAYSFRKLKSTYAGPAIRLRRASDNAEQDIGFLGFTSFTGAPIDTAAAAAHCAATTCFGVTLYDQSGNARHLTQATPANQPPLVFNCIGTLPCLQTSTASHALVGPSITPATGIATLNVVANRSAGTAQCVLVRENGVGTANRMFANTANSWFVAAGAVLSATVTDNVWHSALGLVNGVSSQFIIDGASTAGTTGAGSVAAGTPAISGGASVTCNEAEVVIWDNYLLTAPEVTALTANQRAFWGF